MLEEHELGAPTRSAPEAASPILITTMPGANGDFDVQLETIPAGGRAAEWPLCRSSTCWLDFEPMAATRVSANTASVISQLPCHSAPKVEPCSLRVRVSLPLRTLH